MGIGIKHLCYQFGALLLALMCYDRPLYGGDAPSSEAPSGGMTGVLRRLDSAPAATAAPSEETQSSWASLTPLETLHLDLFRLIYWQLNPKARQALRKVNKELFRLCLACVGKLTIKKQEKYMTDAPRNLRKPLRTLQRLRKIAWGETASHPLYPNLQSFSIESSLSDKIFTQYLYSGLFDDIESLELNSKRITGLGLDALNHLRRLRSLKLHPYQHLPLSGLSRLKQLESLRLKRKSYGDKDTPYVSLDESLDAASLSALKSLNVHAFKGNIDLKNLSSLHTLKLSKPQASWEDLRSLTQLETLYLKRIDLDFKHLGASWVTLSALRKLIIKHSDALTELVFPVLKSLRSLSIAYCKLLTELNLEALTQLEWLYLIQNDSIEKLTFPESQRLKAFEMRTYSEPVYIHGESLANLKSLELKKHPGNSTELTLPLKTAKDSLNTCSLYSFNINESDLNVLKQLQKLTLTNIESIVELDLSNLAALRHLQIKACYFLKSLNLFQLDQLSSVIINGCIYLIAKLV